MTSGPERSSYYSESEPRKRGSETIGKDPPTTCNDNQPLSTKSIKGPSRPLESVHDVEGGDGLAAWCQGMLAPTR